MDRIHSSRSKCGHLATLKIDFTKAFDRLSWQFLICVLEKMNFPQKIINLIFQCISTVSYNFQLNGQIIFSLQPQNGIRQGDPLSPYLYILAANVLSCLIEHAHSAGNWPGIKICRDAAPITHLLYADDSLFFWKHQKDTFRMQNLSWTCTARGLGRWLTIVNPCSFLAPKLLMVNASTFPNCSK